jgi:hypothetical protein
MATAGASATLAGLVFVALSVNIARILQVSHLPSRAGATIASLMVILVCSMATLIPQPERMVGVEIAGFAFFGWLLKAWSAYRGFVDRVKNERPIFEAVVEAVLGQLQVLPFFGGALLLMRGDDAGFYWIAGGIITGFVFSVFNGWVLLVEILR